MRRKYKCYPEFRASCKKCICIHTITIRNQLVTNRYIYKRVTTIFWTDCWWLVKAVCMTFVSPGHSWMECERLEVSRIVHHFWEYQLMVWIHSKWVTNSEAAIKWETLWTSTPWLPGHPSGQVEYFLIWNRRTIFIRISVQWKEGLL